MESTEKLVDIEKRLQRATPGPWIGVAHCTTRYVIQTGERIICYMNESGSPNSIQMKNGFLIASAPTDVAYLLARLQAAEAVCEFVDHDYHCILKRWEAGEPTPDGGYRMKYDGKWYQSRPVDETPKCTCAIGKLLTTWQQTKG